MHSDSLLTLVGSADLFRQTAAGRQGDAKIIHFGTRKHHTLEKKCSGRSFGRNLKILEFRKDLDVSGRQSGDSESSGIPLGAKGIYQELFGTPLGAKRISKSNILALGNIKYRKNRSSNRCWE